MAYNTKNAILSFFVFLFLSTAAYAAPVANAGSDQTTSVSQNVTLSGAVSTCESCSIVSYSWNFGDGETGSGVSTTHSYSSAAIYTVTLTVVANTSEISSDSASVTVQSGDATPPTITHTNVTNWSVNTSLPISATVTDNVGVSSVLLYYSANGTSYSSTEMSANGNTYSGTVPSSATNGSRVYYYITATDSSSNSASSPSGGSSTPVNVTLGADTIPPITSLVSISADATSPYWVTTSNSTSNNAQVIVTGEALMVCRMGPSNSNYSGMTVGYVECTISGSTANCSDTLGDNNYTRFVACKDSTGNEQNTTQTINATFGVDSTAPSAISQVNSTEYVGGVALAWVAATDATSGPSVQKIYRSANSSGTACSSNYSSIASASASASAYNDTSGTAGTTYCYRVYGLDTAGNLQGSSGTSGAQVFGVPLISAISLSTQGVSLNLSATTSEAAYCRYSTSNLQFANMTSNFTAGENSTTHSTLINGSGVVTYYASCQDSVGNNMTTANSTSFSYQLSLRVLSPTATVYANSTVVLNFTVGNATGSYACRYSIDGSANTTITGCANYTNITSLSDGAHSLRVYANDTVNTTLGSVGFVVDTGGVTTNATSETVTVNSSITGISVPSGYNMTQVNVPSSVTATTTVSLLLPQLLNVSTLNASVMLNVSINVTRNTSGTNYSLSIPANITITGPSNWTGELNLPTVKANSSVTVTGGTATGVVEIGFPNVSLTFNKAVRILFSGQASMSVGYSRSGTFTAISTTCTDDTQATNNLLAAGADCKTTSGSNLIVWTKHFTSFVTYTPDAAAAAAAATSSGSSTGGGAVGARASTPSTSTAGASAVAVDIGNGLSCSVNVARSLSSSSTLSSESVKLSTDGCTLGKFEFTDTIPSGFASSLTDVKFSLAPSATASMTATWTFNGLSSGETVTLIYSVPKYVESSVGKAFGTPAIKLVQPQGATAPETAPPSKAPEKVKMTLPPVPEQPPIAEQITQSIKAAGEEAKTPEAGLGIFGMVVVSGIIILILVGVLYFAQLKKK